jgi:muramoyltetrapeptide carboxypeptidase
MPSRRAFLGSTVAGVAAAAAAPRTVRAAVRAATRERRALPRRPVVRPPRLERGDVIGLINPCSVPLAAADVTLAREHLERLGLQLKVSPVVREGRESVECRADDVNAMFADDNVKGLLPMRGGWGCARLLPHLDYKLIAAHPKILMGYSDVAALLLGINARTGLVTFHGPMGNSAWGAFTVDHLRRILFEGEAATLCKDSASADDGDARPETRLRTITPGKARGRLVGGNLTVMASMVGSKYLGGTDDVILFLEEVREPTSEVDRMLTTLEMAGILGRVRGFVFGQCTRCPAPELDGSLTLDRVLDDHVRVLGIPAWRGAPIGHVERQLTVPIGLPVEMDATRGTIRLLEPAVT